MKKNTPEKIITVEKLAKYAGWTKRRVYQVAEEGRLPKPVKGKMPFDESIAQLCAFLQRDSEQLKKEKLALVTANRMTREHELAEAQRRFVLREVAFQTILAALTKFKGFVCEEIEKKLVADEREKLKALGVADETIAQFFVWSTAKKIALIDAVESKCEEEAKSENAITI